MNHWKINNMTNRNLLIQQNENDVSIVEPLNNGSFKILSEFKLNTPSFLLIHMMTSYMFQSILKMKKLTFTINRMNNTIILIILLTKLF